MSRKLKVAQLTIAAVFVAIVIFSVVYASLHPMMTW